MYLSAGPNDDYVDLIGCSSIQLSEEAFFPWFGLNTPHNHSPTERYQTHILTRIMSMTSSGYYFSIPAALSSLIALCPSLSPPVPSSMIMYSCPTSVPMSLLQFNYPLDSESIPSHPCRRLQLCFHTLPQSRCPLTLSLSLSLSLSPLCSVSLSFALSLFSLLCLSLLHSLSLSFALSLFSLLCL